MIATDASPAMRDLARTHAPAVDMRVLALPDDPYVLTYLPDQSAVWRALANLAGCLRPQGMLVLDMSDLAWATASRVAPNFSAVGDDWAIITRFSIPSPDRFVREITTFVRDAVEPAMLAEPGVTAEIRPASGAEQLPDGLVAVVGVRTS